MRALNTSPNSAEISEIHPFAIMTCSGSAEVVYMNPACMQLIDSAGIPPEHYARILPEDYRDIITRLRAGEPGLDFEERREGKLLRFIFRASADRQHVFVFVVDKTEEEAARARMQQNEKMASLGLLIAGLAHEINTPLGAIQSNNDIVARGLEKLKESLSAGGRNVDAGAARILSVLDEVCRNSAIAADRLNGIVGSLRKFGRVDESELKQVNIHEGIDSTLVLLEHQFKNRIRVVKEYGDIPLVHCYPNRLNQVFMNVLVNAGQAIPAQGTVTIRTSMEAGQVMIDISDTGTGIAPESLQKIFDPGFTTKGVGVGTGLGLSICYRIVQEHHGSINVESSGEGTTFRIKLPLHSGSREKHVCS